MVFMQILRSVTKKNTIQNMYRKQSVLVLIPARGGSKRLPNKNILPLGGKPLIARAVLAAKGSRYADSILVTTDNPAIAKIAQKAGAEVPFMRPAKLAGDASPIIATIVHALKFLKKEEHWQPDIVVLVQPTSPFVLAKDIDSSIETLVRQKVNSSVSVIPITERPEWMFTLKKEMLEQRFKTPLFIRSQDLPALYRLNGAVYASRHSVYAKKTTFDTKNLAGVVMPPERSIDIDTPEDLKAAQILCKTQTKK